MSKEKVLTKKDLRKAAWRWLIGISTFNYETQLAPSALFSVYPCLRKMYPDDEDLKKSCLNYMRYYNTMPWISPFVIGAALGIEDEGGIDSLDAVNDFKVGLMGPSCRYRRYDWLGNDSDNLWIYCRKYGYGRQSAGNLPVGCIHLCISNSAYSSV